MLLVWKISYSMLIAINFLNNKLLFSIYILWQHTNILSEDANNYYIQYS